MNAFDFAAASAAVSDSASSSFHLRHLGRPPRRDLRRRAGAASHPRRRARRHVRRAARRDGRLVRRHRRARLLAVEGRLRSLRDRAASLPAQIRRGDAGEGRRSRRHAGDAGKARVLLPTHTKRSAESEALQQLSTPGPARLPRRTGGRSHPLRYRARTLRRHRPARHLRRACGRNSCPQRARRHARRAARPFLSRRARDAARCRPYPRSSRSRLSIPPSS